MQKHETTARLESAADRGSDQCHSTAAGIRDEASRILDQLVLLRDDKTVSDPSGRLFLERAIDFMCTMLVNHDFTPDALESPVARRGLANWQVRRVTNYMREHLDQEIGLEELASLANLSRFHFCTAFRMATGRTPYEWLTHERLARSKYLLANSTLRITDIALAVGYATPSAFAAVFRRVMGQTPREFRRRL